MRRLCASWFGSGLILGRLRNSDLGSGTVAAAFTFAGGTMLMPLGWRFQMAAAAVVAGMSVWASAPYSDPGREDPSAPGVPTTKEGDPGWVVIDEAAGTLVAMIGLPLWPALVGWVVFRLADIFKKRFPGVGRAEGIGGGWGITADDLVAGLYGLASGWIVHTVLG